MACGNGLFDPALVVRAFIEFDREQMGQFPVIDFSWEGENDNDPGCGRGWGALREDRLGA